MEGEKKRIRLIVDSSILVSYLARAGYIRRFIDENADRLELIVPDYAIIEVEEFLERDRDRLRRKGVDVEVLELAFYTLAEKLVVVPRHVYMDRMDEAYRIARCFDEKDTPFIALALKLGIPVWTRDKDMIIHGLRSRRYIALDTKAVEELLSGEKLEDVLENLAKRYSEQPAP